MKLRRQFATAHKVAFPSLKDTTVNDATIRTTPITCVIIDDDKDDQLLLESAITEAMPELCALVFFDDAESALETLKQDTSAAPDIIFLDMILPKLTGTEALIALREIPKLQSVPLIVSSGSSLIIGDEELIRQHATHYLVKPNSLTALIGMLNKVLKGKHADFMVLPPES